MERAYNFSAGPAVLPLSVLKRAAAEMLNFDETGMSVMEMSHRSRSFEDILEKSERSLRELMEIPDNYKVLFLQGGASMQFEMIPLNLMVGSGRADFVNTGLWSKRAIAECGRFGQVNVVASSEDKVFCYIPELDSKSFDEGADYFHITLNNTIYGTRFDKIPDTGGVTLVADVSSCILSEKIDVKKFGVLYAGAQKNIGPSGLCIVIIREDLIGRAPKSIPTMLDYKTHAENGSMYNTPPTYGIYIAGLVFEWLGELGGVSTIEKINREKAAALYDYLDNSRLFSATVKPPFRSIMNIPFVLPTNEQNAKFIRLAEENGFVNLKGHRSVGGMRASIYNAFPIDGVHALIDFMKKFEETDSAI